ncbi:helicase DnaB [Intrasporangium oryzae NRRL B-24470]|uniref:Helicase DnaB n=1 Tax=Intrasporangium oryzae NRRL B-24470 TaxID=1386089 RepID=W9G9G0_9MICO|nr:DnaB-like helicase C-terminal domain-containing protein [Intrasporangium oryzae]EWT01468.1 helicase DnaB [Intrasporangium oryzae NRRL B-24470]
MATPPGHHEAGALRSLGSLLSETDAVLRRGQAAGAAVWPTQFPALDRMLTGGLRSGELVLLGGPAGHGKTTLGLQLARNAVAAGGSAVVFSYEHEAHTLLERLISMEAAEAVEGGVVEAAGVHDVRRALEAGSGGAPLDAVLSSLPGGAEAYAALVGYGDRLHIHESSGGSTTLAEVSAVVRRVSEATGSAPLVLLDYIQKLPVPGAGEDERISIAAEGLKDIALELRVPVVAVSAADKESLAAGHRMRTHDLRGSSSLAYEADVVMIINDKVDIVSREHLVYDLGNAQRFRGWSVLSLEKNRHGRAHVELEFAKDFEHGRFHREGREVTERLIDERVFVS